MCQKNSGLLPALFATFARAPAGVQRFVLDKSERLAKSLLPEVAAVADAVRELPEGAEQLLLHFTDTMLAAVVEAGEGGTATNVLAVLGEGVLHKLRAMDLAASPQLLIQHAGYFPRD